jgi:hypothetical protein
MTPGPPSRAPGGRIDFQTAPGYTPPACPGRAPVLPVHRRRPRPSLILSDRLSTPDRTCHADSQQAVPPPPSLLQPASYRAPIGCTLKRATGQSAGTKAQLKSAKHPSRLDQRANAESRRLAAEWRPGSPGTQTPTTMARRTTGTPPLSSRFQRGAGPGRPSSWSSSLATAAGARIRHASVTSSSRRAASTSASRSITSGQPS